MDFAAVNRQIGELERRIGEPAELSPGEQLFVGVDLGTAYIVVVVVNAERKPVACALEFAQVVRDGLVVDYTGATRIVRKLVQQLGERLGRELELAAIAVPPGTGERECATHRHVVEGAGLTVTSVLDEPTAANAVLGVENGVIVDIGGGTADIAVISLGGTVVSTSVKTAGDDFDEAIVRYMRKKHNLLIGERTAEDIKISIGSAYKRPELITMEVRGRDLVSGLPKTVTITSDETLEALRENPDIDYMHMCMAAEAGIKQFVKDYMKVIGSSGRYIYGEAVVKSNE